MTALYVILGIIAFFVLILSIKVRVDAEYFESFKLRVSWLFLHFDVYPMPPKKPKKPKKEKPQEEEEPAPEEPPVEDDAPKKPNIFKKFYENQGFEGVLDLLHGAVDALGSMMKSVKNHLILEELYLWVIVSQGSDAAATALAYGNICQQVFPALGFICSNLKVKKYDAEVEPDFIGTFPSAQFATAISIRPIFIINAGIVMVCRLIKNVVLKLLFSKPKTKKAETSDINKETQNIQGGASK